MTSRVEGKPIAEPRLPEEKAWHQPVPPKRDEGEPDRGRRPDSGYIGLQNHPDNPAVIFKEVAIRSIGH